MTDAAKRKGARRAAEEDAREALLAVGVIPPSEEELQQRLNQLLAPPPAPAPRWYSKAEFCQITGVSVSTFDRHYAKGDAPTMKLIMGQWRISEADLQAWIASRPEKKSSATHEVPKPPLQLVQALRKVRSDQGRKPRSKAKRVAPLRDDPPGTTYENPHPWSS